MKLTSEQLKQIIMEEIKRSIAAGQGQLRFRDRHSAPAQMVTIEVDGEDSQSASVSIHVDNRGEHSEVIFNLEINQIEQFVVALQQAKSDVKKAIEYENDDGDYDGDAMAMLQQWRTGNRSDLEA